MDVLDELFGPPTEMDLLEETNRLDEKAWIRALVALRGRRGLTQEQVGALMGISQSGVARIESCARDVRLSSLSRYALAVGARVQHFATPAEASTRYLVYIQPDSEAFLEDSEENDDRIMPATYSVRLEEPASMGTG